MFVSFCFLVSRKVEKWSPEEQDLWKDFKARSRCIEVLYQPVKDSEKKILTKVYFDFDPLVRVLIMINALVISTVVSTMCI